MRVKVNRLNIIGTIIGSQDNLYIVESSNKTYYVPPSIVEEMKEYEYGDYVLFKRKDGNHIVFTKGHIKDKTKTRDNEGNEIYIYTVSIGGKDFEVKEDQIETKLDESINESEDTPPYKDHFETIEKIMYDVFKEVQSKHKYGNPVSFEAFKRAILPDIQFFPDGHIKIFTTDGQNNEGHVVLKAVPDGKYEVKQVRTSHPEANPFSIDDMKGNPLSAKEIKDRLKNHVEYHYKRMNPKKSDD